MMAGKKRSIDRAAVPSRARLKRATGELAIVQSSLRKQQKAVAPLVRDARKLLSGLLRAQRRYAVALIRVPQLSDDPWATTDKLAAALMALLEQLRAKPIGDAQYAVRAQLRYLEKAE